MFRRQLIRRIRDTEKVNTLGRYPQPGQTSQGGRVVAHQMLDGDEVHTLERQPGLPGFHQVLDHIEFHQRPQTNVRRQVGRVAADRAHRVVFQVAIVQGSCGVAQRQAIGSGLDEDPFERFVIAMKPSHVCEPNEPPSP